MIFRNARTRLILASVVLSGAVAAIVLAFVYVTVISIIETETRSVVEAELAGLERDYGRLGTLGLASAIAARIGSADRRDAVYLLTDGRGRVIAGNLEGWPPTIEPGGGWVEVDLIRSDTERDVPVAAASLRLPGGERLLVGRDASAAQQFDNALFQSALWGLAGAIALSVVTGWLLTRLIFSRIAEISRTADTIVTGDLGRRVPISGTGDELDALSETLNEMLDRISELIDNLRMTTTSLSHDLRSPLTRLRANLERMGHKGGTEDGALAGKSLEEVDRLLAIFDSLTEIARAETRLSQEDFQTLDLGALLTDCVDLYGPVAEAQGVTLVARGEPVEVRGHRQLLLLALSNLVENALRFAPASSEIGVAVAEGGGIVSIDVSDEGPGVPEGFLADATKPFKTADASRSDGGTGLGLALVAAVARLHNGDVHLANTRPGLRVTLSLGPSGGGA